MTAVLMRAQLFAIRAQIDALLIGLDEAAPLPMPVLGACPRCQAPEQKQVDASTMAVPNRKLCLVCQQEYDG